MNSTFADGLKQSVTVVVLGCFIAGGLGTVKAPSAVDNDQTAAVSVNRTNKGDRLPSAATTPVHSTLSLSNEKSPAPPKRPPLGCDPVFSPIADPAKAHIYRHCTA